MFSRAAGREGRCRQISQACVGRICSVPATLGLPLLAVCAFPVYIAQAPGSSIGSWPWVACGSSFWVLHKSTDLVGPRFCAFPGPSSSGSQEIDELTLPGCGAPYHLRGLSLVTLLVGIKLVQPLWRTVWRFLKKTGNRIAI